MISKQKTSGRRERILIEKMLGSARVAVKRRKPITSQFAGIVKTWNLMTELKKRYNQRLRFTDTKYLKILMTKEYKILITIIMYKKIIVNIIINFI